MDIAFHSLVYILTSWFLISTTFCDIALQPGFDQTGQFRYSSPNIQSNPYQPFQPHQTYQQPYYGQTGQMPHNLQPQSFPLWSNPWMMMGYRPYQQPFGQAGLPGPSPNFLVASNQFQPRGLDAELQRARELQQKLSAHMSGFSQSNSAQVPQQASTPIYPTLNVPYYSFYPPYVQSSSNFRAHRSLPIFQSQGYQIIKLRDLQNAHQQFEPMDSRSNPGVNPQTHHSQYDEMATNSSITLSQLEMNPPTLNEKVDDDIVGSPLQIHKLQSSFSEQHHPVDLVHISDDSYVVKNTSEIKDNMNMIKNNVSNFSNVNGRLFSNSSNDYGNFSQESPERIEQEVNYVEHFTDNPKKDISGEVKSQSIHQHSSHKNYAISSGARGDDKSITNIHYPLFDRRINYNQPQVFRVGLSPQSSFIPQMDSINSQASKFPTALSYQLKTDNDFYNSYKNYPPINGLTSSKFHFAYDQDTPYNTVTNTVNKEPTSWQPPSLSTARYVSNWNNFGNEYYQQ